MAVPNTIERVTGRVTSVNPKGLKLDGGSDWLNFSKYAQDIVPPTKGQTVTLGLDSAGFIRTVEPADGVQGLAASLPAPSGQRETVITRLAVLKAAAEFAAARPQVKSVEVLKIAASWERWVNRQADAADPTDV